MQSMLLVNQANVLAVLVQMVIKKCLMVEHVLVKVIVLVVGVKEMLF